MDKQIKTLIDKQLKEMAFSYKGFEEKDILIALRNSFVEGYNIAIDKKCIKVKEEITLSPWQLTKAAKAIEKLGYSIVSLHDKGATFKKTIKSKDI